MLSQLLQYTRFLGAIFERDLGTSILYSLLRGKTLKHRDSRSGLSGEILKTLEQLNCN